MVARIEAGERFVTLGHTALFRVTRDGVSYMVAARLKSVKRLTKPGVAKASGQ